MAPGGHLVCHTPGNSITSPGGSRDARNFREHRIDRRFLGSLHGFVSVIYNELEPAAYSKDDREIKNYESNNVGSFRPQLGLISLTEK